MSDDIFFCVWNPRGSVPTFRHGDLGSAKDEAKRLARVNPGHTFYVLAGVLAYTKNDVIETRLAETDPDFQVPF